MPEKHWRIHKRACRAHQKTLEGTLPEIRESDGSLIPLALVSRLAVMKLTHTICYPLLDPTVLAFLDVMEQLKVFHSFMTDATEEDTEYRLRPSFHTVRSGFSNCHTRLLNRICLGSYRLGPTTYRARGGNSKQLGSQNVSPSYPLCPEDRKRKDRRKNRKRNQQTNNS